MPIKSSSKNLIKMDENEYVMAFKDLFGISSRDKFPNDFDAWDVKNQFDWLNQNIEKFFPNVPQSLLSFIPAAFCELNYDRSLEELPEWMDMDKYRRGQKFAKKHYAALFVSKIIGLMYVYSFADQLRSLILGEHSHTPHLGFQKYVSTLKRILNWYNGDPWVKGTEAYKDMQVTRGMHLAIRRKVCQMDHEQITTASTFANPWCPDREVLLKDFAVACPPEKFGQRPYITSDKSLYKPKGVNNADLSGVQSGFVVMSLLYPESIGIHNATDEDLEAFAHMWRCYGYYLGLEDEYNFCRGSLEEIKLRLRDFYQYWIIQNLKEMTPEWEHITRCLVVHANYYPLLYMPYKAMVLIATDALNIKVPHLYASLNYAEWIAYKSYKFIFYLLKFPIVRAVVNRMMHKIIDKASNFNAEELAEIHEKSNKVLPDFSLTYK